MEELNRKVSIDFLWFVVSFQLSGAFISPRVHQRTGVQRTCPDSEPSGKNCPGETSTGDARSAVEKAIDSGTRWDSEDGNQDSEILNPDFQILEESYDFR